jgi:signal transduction histidine kinase
MFVFLKLTNIFQSAVWRFFLILGSLAVVLFSVYFTLNLANELKRQERKQLELFADAQLSMMDFEKNSDFTFESKIIESNTTVPMIMVDAEYNIIGATNYKREFEKDPIYFKNELKILKNSVKPLVLENKKLGITNYIYYRQSTIISYLEWFPYIQFSLLFVFFTLAYLTFSSIRKSQQERIWVGMAKETAHQLGTPLSSLMGWIENLKTLYPEDEQIKMICEEMNRDLDMLEIVAGRFSKIGAKPELSSHNLFDRIKSHYDYIIQRAPKKVKLEFPDFEHTHPVFVSINAILFDWVIENLLKNALDAMDGKGLIKVEVTENQRFVFIDVSDSGKGIPKSLFNKVFKPGFSTKKRGWGLGLSLSKRIVSDYHSGKIFVKQSVLNQGTTFRVQLPKPKTK